MLNSSNSAGSHCHVSVSMGHCRMMLLAALSRNCPVNRCVM